MPTTLENALEKISDLESRIARLERMVIGSNGEIAFPQLNADLAMADLEIKPVPDTKPNQPEIIHIESALETVFPNIAENLTLIWGHPECEDYLNKLMINNRSNRQGFSLDVMSELMLLLGIREREHTDIWADCIKSG